MPNTPKQLDLAVSKMTGTVRRTPIENELLRAPAPLRNAVLTALGSGEWMSGQQIIAHASSQMHKQLGLESVKATIRDLRKKENGGHEVKTRPGIPFLEYKLVLKR